jgi:hypothetical protein
MLGRHSFLMPLLWQHVPTFSLFRIPARALIVVDLILAIMAAIGLDVIAGWVATRGRQGARIAIVLVALACVVQLVDLAYHARANRRYLHTRPRPLMEQPFAVRLADTLAGDGSWYRYWFHPESFRENHAYALGARSVTGYDNMYLERYRRFFYFMTDTAIDPLAVTGIGRDTFGNARSLFPFKILGVKYAAYRGQLVVNPEPVRRAWFVTRARRVASEDQALAYMRSERFDPQREVIFEPVEADRLELPTREVSSAAGDAIDLDIVVTEVSPEHLRIELGPHPEGYVVLSEMFYPGWRAYAGGRELPIYRADYLLRALRVAAGGHLAIDVVFEPASLRYGALVTSATLLVVVALLGWPRRSPTSRRGQQAHADRPAHSRS